MIQIRNLAIIAHVDHGKTTLVDCMLKQSGAYKKHQAITERVMDSNDLEKERGITILAKCTAMEWKNIRLNIVDTPGHADFGGEVERILSMVDGVLLLVDAAEGPMPQTKFVLSKALQIGLKPIVVINKVDKNDSRAQEVLDEVFDLFVTLDADEQQLDFPILYASSKEGWAINNLNDPRYNISPIFDTILKYIPSPQKIHPEKPFSMLVSIIEMDPYLGRLLTGKIYSGEISLNQSIHAIDLDGKKIQSGNVSKILAFRYLKRESVKTAQAGDIICLAGIDQGTVTHTVCDPSITEPISAIPIDPPTLEMTFSINNSTLAGLEGKKVTSRVIRERLFKEAETNVSIRVRESEEKDSLIVSGRGELQLGILIETMRREGFELSISSPRVLIKEENGKKLEPFEEVVVDVDDEYTGIVVEKMGIRKAEIRDMRPSGAGKTRIIFIAPTRGLMGYQGEFLSNTRGTGIINRLFHEYAPYKGDIPKRLCGVLISTDTGKTAAYALWKLEERGILFIKPGTEVYQGMIIGENSRPGDLNVNPLKGKQLTNVRASGKDDAIQLAPPTIMTLEQAMSYIADDELIEVTPSNIRLRKRLLLPHERKRSR